MSAVMTIDHMSQLVDALDRQDFPALLLERLETLVPFDLYAVFFYDGESAPACLHSNFRPARRNARCIATRAARSVITRFSSITCGASKAASISCPSCAARPSCTGPSAIATASG